MTLEFQSFKLDSKFEFRIWRLSYLYNLYLGVMLAVAFFSALSGFGFITKNDFLISSPLLKNFGLHLGAVQIGFADFEFFAVAN